MIQEHLLIDGFNLLHAASRRGSSGRPGDVQRWVYLMEHFAAARRVSVTVVFDGTRFASQWPSTDVLRLLFSEGGQPADQLIERIMSDIDAAERLSWVLVTDDRALGDMAVGLGLRRRGAAELADEMNRFERAEDLRGSGKAPGSFKEPFNNPFGDL